MKLLLVRHGETDWNLQNRVLGQTDIPLNQNGINQTNRLVDLLIDTPIHAVYTSPLQRALLCASMVAQNHNCVCITDHRLIEMNFGIFEGVQRDDNGYHTEKRNLFSRYPKGESFLQLAGRVYPLLEELKNRHKDDTVLLVTHNGVARVIVNYFEDMSVENFLSFQMQNCEIREFCL